MTYYHGQVIYAYLLVFKTRTIIVYFPGELNFNYTVFFKIENSQLCVLLITMVIGVSDFRLMLF